MILYPVYQGLGMFCPHTESKALGLEFPSLFCKHHIYVPGRMPCSKNHLSGRKDFCLARIMHVIACRNDFCGHTEITVPMTGNISHPVPEMIFASMRDNAVPDIFHYPRKPVAPDMGMRIHQYRRVGTESHELVQDFPYIPPFCRTRIEFPVRKCTGTAFTETVVGVRIHYAFA